ncbi:hypothetical protein BGZ65_012656 [Modicella reniformis]|uniref:Uncharacterized protein n=1 Tax=Modicella reniformis TaxID=1440133 RepID=A0A9P6MLV1_9FUNG|nr:hypothetical protein BGZ65_012656 [Modicella reniformis]
MDVVALRAGLERELASAREEIQRLQGVTEKKEQDDAKQARQELESKIEELTRENQAQGQAYMELEQEVHNLRADKVHHEESCAKMELELKVVNARSEQEAAQYRTLQDSIQRMSSKMTRLESQHETAVGELMEHHKTESEALVENIKKETEASFREERAELDVREKVLRDRILAQSSRNDQLEEDIFRLQKELEASNKEKEVLARTNRSLERHLSMQNLQEQENLYRKEELELDNARLRELLSDLDTAAAKRLSRDNEDVNRELQAAEMFEQQHRKWVEQAELMTQKLVRIEEEARKTMEQNEELKVALELARSSKESSRESSRELSRPSSRQSSRQSSSLRSSTQSLISRVLSPPLSA